MAFLIGTEKAKVEVPSKTVLDEVSLGFGEGERIGIVGQNGDGKSTLLRLFNGDIQPDEGRVIRTTGVRVAFLRQNDELDDGDTVGHAVVGDRPEYEWAADPKVRAVIDGLLFDIDWDAKVDTLSGGQRRRVDLARVLVADCDVLLLDEPTNHLDMRTIAWLAAHLKAKWRPGQGAMLIVSHDRWFLDEVCEGMWEVHDGTVDTFEGGFSAYIMQRVERARIAAVTEQRRQNRLRRELAWLSRGARARATKPKFHVAAARELIADVPELRNPPELKRMAMARIGKDVVQLFNASVDFDGTRVLDGLEWTIGPGDRIGIVGENGAGKTTLLRLIQGQLTPSTGKVKIGATVKFAMLSQRLERLSEFDGYRVREVVGRYPHRRMADGKEVTPAKLLEDLGFSRGDLNEFVGTLSGGQRRRLALMMVLMEESNVLILDEPGNDLDIDMLAALEDLLDGWPGTLVVVTHDRNLMERVTDDQFALIDGKLRHLPGGIDEYINLVPVDRGDGKPCEPEAAPKKAELADAVAESSGAISNKERQRLRKVISSSENKMETLKAKIAEAEEAAKAIDPTDFQGLLDSQAQIAELRERLDELELEWLEATEMLGD